MTGGAPIRPCPFWCQGPYYCGTGCTKPVYWVPTPRQSKADP